LKAHRDSHGIEEHRVRSRGGWGKPEVGFFTFDKHPRRKNLTERDSQGGRGSSTKCNKGIRVEGWNLIITLKPKTRQDLGGKRILDRREKGCTIRESSCGPVGMLSRGGEGGNGGECAKRKRVNSLFLMRGKKKKSQTQ